MPKAAVNENHQLSPVENDIRLAGKTGATKAIATVPEGP